MPTPSVLSQLLRDGNVDIEDLDQLLAEMLTDGLLSSEERRALEQLRAGPALEPAARQLLEDRLAGRPATLWSRLLLAPPPPGAQADLYHPRADVVALQSALVAAGETVAVDGDFGPRTVAAVRRIQSAAGLQPTGWLDSRSLLALNQRLTERGAPLLDLSPRARIRPDRVLATRQAADPRQVAALQKALSALSQHFGLPGLAAPSSGSFDAATEQALRLLQRRFYLPETGILDEGTREAANAALQLAGAPAMPAWPGRSAAAELHFYPGPQEHKVYVLVDGAEVACYGMVGGDQGSRPDPKNPLVGYSPSPQGSYEVVEVSPHASSAWAWSYVPYGAQLREKDGEVEFCDPQGRWRPATGARSAFAGRNPPPLPREAYYADGALLPAWVHNDFGHLRARLRERRSGVLQSHMIHSSPDQEQTSAYFADTRPLLDPAQALRVLRHSHGCEHIHPRDMDDMIARGFLAPGTRFIIHGYDEKRQSAVV